MKHQINITNTNAHYAVDTEQEKYVLYAKNVKKNTKRL